MFKGEEIMKVIDRAMAIATIHSEAIRFAPAAKEATINPNSLKFAKVNDVKTDVLALNLNRVRTNKYKISLKFKPKAKMNAIIKISFVGIPIKPIERKNPIRKKSLKCNKISANSLDFL